MDRSLPYSDRVQVRPGDTAMKIALRLAGSVARVPELVAANPPRDWNRIYAGEILRLPASWQRSPIAPAAVGALSLADARARTPWLDDAFFPKLVSIARKYSLDPRALLGVMYQESGVHPFANPNRVTHANGLIHWMPGTAPNGVTDAQLVAMTATEQLDLVDAWIAPWASRMQGAPFSSAGLIYAIVFAPARLGPTANESTLIFAQTHECTGAQAYSGPYCANRGLDIGGKGQILMSDLTGTIDRRTREASFQKFAVRLAAEGGNPIAPSGGGTPPAGPLGPLGARASSVATFAFVALGTLVVGGVGAALVMQTWRR